MAGVVNNIGGLFYCLNIVGSANMNAPIPLASDIMNKLPNKESCAFIVLHQYSGVRFAYGYFYASKAYGSIFISQYDGRTYHVDIEAENYILR